MFRWNVSVANRKQITVTFIRKQGLYVLFLKCCCKNNQTPPNSIIDGGANGTKERTQIQAINHPTLILVQLQLEVWNPQLHPNHFTDHLNSLLHKRNETPHVYCLSPINHSSLPFSFLLPPNYNLASRSFVTPFQPILAWYIHSLTVYSPSSPFI